MTPKTIDSFFDVVPLPPHPQVCRCGTEEANGFLVEVLDWCGMSQAEKDKKWPKGLYTSVAHELAGKLLDTLGLIDHGTSIGWPWLTLEGHEVVQKLER